MVIRPPPGRTNQKYWIRCTDDWVQYKPSTFKDPRDAGTQNANRFTIGDRKTQNITASIDKVFTDNDAADPSAHGREAFPEGAFYLPGMDATRMLYWEKGKSKPEEQHPFCAPGDHASSVPEFGLMFWCPKAFSEPNWSMDGVQTVLKHNDRLDDVYYSSTLAQKWLRELFEYSYQCQ